MCHLGDCPVSIYACCVINIDMIACCMIATSTWDMGQLICCLTLWSPGAGAVVWKYGMFEHQSKRGNEFWEVIWAEITRTIGNLRFWETIWNPIFKRESTRNMLNWQCNYVYVMWCFLFLLYFTGDWRFYSWLTPKTLRAWNIQSRALKDGRGNSFG